MTMKQQMTQSPVRTLTPTLVASFVFASVAMQAAPAGDAPAPSTKAASKPAAPTVPTGKQADPSKSELPNVPSTPAGITTLVEVREFRLAEGYEHRFSKERPAVAAGYLAVVRAPSDYLAPRQVEMPVLMAGSMPVEPLNVGFASGQVVVIIPSAVDSHGKLTVDLASTPIYFAPPALPEQIDETFAKAQLGLAQRAGITAVDAATLEKAVGKAAAKGGQRLDLANREALDVVAGALVRQYAADEVEVADALQGKTDSTPRPVK